ncbi:MAG: sulfite exporter TauE/SafE family protein [Candidatus Symbiothrix sp.]|jgi:cytochrome c biogenesis protein CcdA|nr:sulfite exporter TauE/SafE family protein [Candidatus Symbiothrix sp.]
MEQFPLLILLSYALYEGLIHAFEADHILAVTNIVSQREKFVAAIKDGIYWGLGHTSTIFLMGVIVILFKVNIPDSSFSYFEAVVGLMLVVVATYRLTIFLKHEQTTIRFHKHYHEHAGENKQLHAHVHLSGKHLHKTSYGIGIVHGLAGSGALVVLIMTQIKSVANSLLYLVIFGIGSIVGMVLVAGIFSLPFSKKTIDSKVLRTILVIISSSLCFFYGCYVIYENFIYLHVR